MNDHNASTAPLDVLSNDLWNTPIGGCTVRNISVPVLFSPYT